MDEVESRLIRCFSSVFSDLTAEQIRAVSVESVPAWDSLAAVTLVAVLQEEFGLQINLIDLPELVSFAGVLNYVRKHKSAS
ncbi:MAG: acyl carrier protein [Candidatus Acidiferrales bacterium]|jgi:acyl carrier protein